MEFQINNPLQCLFALLAIAVITYIGYLLVGLIVGGINGVIRLFNRAVQGSERIEAVVVVAQPDTIREHTPQTSSISVGGSTSLAAQMLISKLFKGTINEDTIHKWIQSGKISLLVTGEPLDNPEFAAKIAVAQLTRQGLLTAETIRKSKVYSIPSKGTERRLTAYLVIVGNIPKPPPQITLEFGE